MALLGCDGGLLGCAGGLSAACCYYGDKCNPVECQECCSKIEGGEFIEGALTFTRTNQYGTFKVKVTGVGTDRLVCKDDVVTIRTEFAPSAMVDPGLAFPVASWDRIWTYLSHSPEIDEDTGYFSEFGLIEWGEVDSKTPRLTLRYNACFEDANEQLGDITIGLEGYGLFVTLTFTTCPGPFIGGCCDDTVECEPCCWVIPLGDGVRDANTNSIVFYSEAGGWQLRVSVDDREVYCETGGGLMTLQIEVIPPIGAEENFGQLSVFHERWYRVGEIPNDPDECSDPENFQKTYPVGQLKATLPLIAYGCDGICFGVPGNTGVTFSGVGVPSLGIEFGLESCDVALGITPSARADCPCCPSEVCCGDCYFEPHPDACQGTNTGGAFDDAPVQIVNMVIETTASEPVYCDGTSSVSRAEQVGQSKQEVLCYNACIADENVRLPFPGCSYQVPMRTVACPGDDENAIVFVKVSYVDNKWEVSAGSGNENTSSCSGASITSTGVINGITYTVVTTFSVTGARGCGQSSGGDGEEEGGEA